MELYIKFPNIHKSKSDQKKHPRKRKRTTTQRWAQRLRNRDADPGIPGTFLEHLDDPNCEFFRWKFWWKFSWATHWHCMALFGSAPQNELYFWIYFKASQVKVSEHSKFWRRNSEDSIHVFTSLHFASLCHRFSSTSLTDSFKCQLWIFSKLHLFSSTATAACCVAPGLQQLRQKLLQPQTTLQLHRLATPATICISF